MDDEKEGFRTFDEIIDELLVKYPEISLYQAQIVTNAISDLIYQDTLLSTPNNELVILALYNQGEKNTKLRKNH